MVSRKRHGALTGVSHGVEKLLNGSNDLAYVLVAEEAALADEPEEEGEAVLLGQVLVDGEVHGKVVPLGMSVAVSDRQGFGFLLAAGVAAED